MRKVSTLLGIGVLAVLLLSFTAKGKCKESNDVANSPTTQIVSNDHPTSEACLGKLEERLFLEDIVYIEDEEEIVLGFDVNDYLPVGFDPYAQAEIDLSDIMYIEEEEEIVLGFNTSDYLPSNFDPYATKKIGSEEIALINAARFENIRDEN